MHPYKQQRQQMSFYIRFGRAYSKQIVKCYVAELRTYAGGEQGPESSKLDVILKNQPSASHILAFTYFISTKPSPLQSPKKLDTTLAGSGARFLL